MTREYTEEDIQVLTAPEAVRRRAGMYIGDVESFEVRNYLIFQCIGLFIKAIESGKCTEIGIAASNNGAVFHFNTGLSLQEQDGQLELEGIFTHQHRGYGIGYGNTPTFGFKKAYEEIGMFIVNGVSRAMTAVVHSKGQMATLHYYKGKLKEPAVIHESNRPDSTEISVKFDSKVFPDTSLDHNLFRTEIEVLRLRFPEVSFSVSYDYC